MKGIIIYSSKTGNTKTMAEAIYDKLRGFCDMEIADINEKKDPQNYDFALIGGWIDKSYPDSKALKLIKSTKQNNLRLFATLGAMPNSEHGIKVEKNMNELLKDKNSLGVFECPGLVDPKLIDKMKGFTAKIIPAHIRDQMVETGIKSRYATKEELDEASNYFLEKVKTLDI